MGLNVLNLCEPLIMLSFISVLDESNQASEACMDSWEWKAPAPPPSSCVSYAVAHIVKHRVVKYRLSAQIS